MKIKISEIHKYLKEGDILLFKAPNFPKLGWWISKYTNSPYSHVGLVHYIDNIPYCIEFKEFIGCRIYPLKDYVMEDCDKIDVFRTVKHICYNNHVHNWTKDIALNITHEAKKFIGKKYGWSLILLIARAYIPLMRLFVPLRINDNNNNNNFVCSSFISYLWRKYYVDIVSFLPDSFTKPSDIARSPIIEYMYTLTCEEKNG